MSGGGVINDHNDHYSFRDNLLKRGGFTPNTQYGTLDVFWVSIEGPIGAGKSTLMEKLRGQLQAYYGEHNVVLMPENIDKLMQSGLFQEYQKDPKRWAYLFQTKMFHHRTIEFMIELHQLEKTAQATSMLGGWWGKDAKKKKVVVITERSIMSGEAFMNVQRRCGNVTDMEYDTYMDMHQMWKSLNPVHPSLIIYCTPGVDKDKIVDTCQERIVERDRDSEKELVTKAYNKVVLEEHENLFGGGAFPIPVMRVDTTENYKSDDRIAMKKSAEVLDAINKHWH